MQLTHCKVSHSGVQCGATQNEPQNCHSLADGNMPGPLIESARAHGPGDRNKSGDQIWRTSQNQRKGTIEAQSLRSISAGREQPALGDGLPRLQWERSS